MVERLESLARTINPRTNEYANDVRLAHRLSSPRGGGPVAQLKQEAALAMEFLLAGKSEVAARRFERLLEGPRSASDLIDEDFRSRLLHSLAIAHLRTGEQANCLARRNEGACIFPIRAAGVHTDPAGSTKAIAVYERILEARPDDLNARWLLNIARMTLGQHPEGLDDRWVLPPSVFASGHDIGRFVDVAPQLGIDALGLAGGVVLEDLDGNGFLDVMVSSWGQRDQLRLFMNDGDGSFTERTKAAGLVGLTGGLNTNHADYDNDGDADVLVLRGAWRFEDGRLPNSLLRNEGDGTFKDVTEEAGLLSFEPTQTAAWADFDNDGWLDLFVGNESGGGVAHPCRLYRNNEDGTFTEGAAQAGIAVVGFVKAVVAGDFDNDGRMDIYVSRLDGDNHLFKNVTTAGGPLRFIDVAKTAGVTAPKRSFPAWFFDFDNDGWLDLFVSGYGASAGDVAADYLGLPHSGVVPRLYRNQGDGTFEDATARAKLDTVLYTMGCNFGDLDNDGFVDFYVGTGDPSYLAIMPNRMFHNAGGEFFEDVTASGGFGHLQKGHGVAFGDIDHDGDQDIYEVMGGAYSGDIAHNALYENPGHGHHALRLVLRGVSTNRSAIGARIHVRVRAAGRLRSIHAVVGTGGSFGSGPLRAEIGLGDAEAIEDVSVFWPRTGLTERFTGLALDRAYAIVEGRPAEPIVSKRIDLSPRGRD